MRFRDFEHFIEAWMATTRALRTEQDYRELVVDYAAARQAQGAVYLEAIFSPSDKLVVGRRPRGRLRRASATACRRRARRSGSRSA